MSIDVTWHVAMDYGGVESTSTASRHEVSTVKPEHLLSFVFKKPKGNCPEPDDASSEFQAARIHLTGRGVLCEPYFVFDMFCVCPGYY